MWNNLHKTQTNLILLCMLGMLSWLGVLEGSFHVAIPVDLVKLQGLGKPKIQILRLSRNLTSVCSLELSLNTLS